MIERNEIWETIGVGRGPVALEPIFRAIEDYFSKGRVTQRSECFHEVEVAGSIPASPTLIWNEMR